MTTLYRRIPVILFCGLAASVVGCGGGGAEQVAGSNQKLVLAAPAAGTGTDAVITGAPVAPLPVQDPMPMLVVTPGAVPELAGAPTPAPAVEPVLAVASVPAVELVPTVEPVPAAAAVPVGPLLLEVGPVSTRDASSAHDVSLSLGASAWGGRLRAPAKPDTDMRITLQSGETLLARADGQSALLDRSALPTDAGSAEEGQYSAEPGQLVVQFQGGDERERWARIMAEPRNPINRTLTFQLMEANVRDAAGNATKGRVQLNAYSAEAVRAPELRFRTRMLLGSDFAMLRTLPKPFRWLTISEWWNNAGWTGEPYPFRISVNLAKPSASVGAPLIFDVRAEVLNPATQKWDIVVWQQSNNTASVPIGQWVTMEYYLREGGPGEGRFYLAIEPDAGERVVVFDVQGWTHHPNDPSPDGFTHLNPLKLYTDKELIDHVRGQGGSLRVQWDDLEFRLCRQIFAQSTSPCRPGAQN